MIKNYLTLLICFIILRLMNLDLKWSQEQKKIFNWFCIGKKHCIVEARAGSAKTTTIIEGLNRASSPEMAYVVFNKINQVEAQKRVLNQKVEVLTFHALGYRFLRNHWKGVRGSAFAEYGRCQRLFPAAPKQVHFQVARLVSFLKNLYINPNQKNVMDTIVERGIDAGNHKTEYPLEKLSEMALEVIKISLEYPKDKLISFEDMVWVSVALNLVKPIYTLLAGDEMQDCNLPQFELLKRSVKPNGRICFVSDPFQNCYYFRGSMQNSMEKFQLELNAEKFTLTTSYRCPKRVIGMAQLIVPDIQAAPDAIEGEVYTLNEEKMLKEIKVKDVILSRNNFALVSQCLNLIKKNIPAYCLGRDVGKGLIDILNGLEAKSIVDFYDKLQKWRDNKIQAATGWNAGRVSDLVSDQYECLKVLAENCLEVSQIESKINSLFFDSEYVRIPSVICSTVHKFKGKEAENIFILSDTFSSGRRQLNAAEMEQERNLRYISQTRSLKKLIFVSTK